jgi:hypothetical protein
MTLEEKIDLLLSRGITKTRFTSLNLNAGMIAGVPLGQGKCKAVLLKANHYETYTQDRAAQGSAQDLKFYYGDKNQQTVEYLVNPNEAADNTNQRDSQLIFCEDLQDVWVRFADAEPEMLEIQITIYY